MALFWQTPKPQPAPPKVPLSPLALALLLRLRASEAKHWADEAPSRPKAA